MTADKQKSPSDEQRFDQDLQYTRRRRTQERTMVLDCVETLQGHFTADDVVGLLSEGKANVAVATVYSTLELLTECGILDRRHFDGRTAYYEKASSPHMHLVCTRCGKIRDLRDRNIDSLVATRRFSSFVPSHYAMTVYGLCGTCSRASGKKNKQTQTISKSQKRK